MLLLSRWPIELDASAPGGSMRVLGVNPGFHDGSAAIVVDGELVAFYELERVTRKKRALGLPPGRAIEACLQETGMALGDMDAIAVGWAEMPQHQVDISDRVGVLSALLDGASLRPEHAEGVALRFVEHHLAHAAASFCASGYDDSAVLVIDGRGERVSTSIGAASTRAGITWDQTWPVEQSLGNFYAVAAEWTGLSFWDAGKLMGLAGYGSPTEPMPLGVSTHGYRLDVSGAHAATTDHSDLAAFREELTAFFRSNDFPYAAGDGAHIMAHASFACSVQAALERACLALAERALDLAGVRRIVLGGGVAMNCSMVGSLVRALGDVEIYVPPFVFDAGVALGAAHTVASEETGQWAGAARLDHPYLSRDLPDEEVVSALTSAGLPYESYGNDLPKRVADLISRGAIVGWVQGRAEVGQRALGGRSILADPRDRSMLLRVNELKDREWWRPLAPSVLVDYFYEVFGAPASPPCDFMLAAYSVQRRWAQLVPAIVHADGSARPQAVRAETHPRYWRLLEEFRLLTGVPLVINTSYNLAGEAISLTAADAVEMFQRSTLDALAIGDHLVQRWQGIA